MLDYTPPFFIEDSTPDRVSTLKHALDALDHERENITKVNMFYSWLLIWCFRENIHATASYICFLFVNL